jgi:hypothetical protein
VTYNYTTLFDSYYLNRALAMYQSLVKNCPAFHLYIFAFDEKSEALLKKMNLAYVTVISLTEFEDERLLAVKNTRGKGEYCWTCTPSTVYYCITRFNLDHCTYIDADLYFFSNPNVLVDELKGGSVLITEHRYTKRYDQSAKSGIYCVQFVTFRNTTDGMKVLTWWRDRCIEWCFDRFEDGKFGDQKYLDDWPVRFGGVHVLQHLGGGVAPWNVQQLAIFEDGESYSVLEKRTGRTNDLVFYHFHALTFLRNGMVDLGTYRLHKDARTLYRDYLVHIAAVNETLKSLGFNPIVQSYRAKKSIPHILHKLARWILGVYHIHNMNKYISYGSNS